MKPYMGITYLIQNKIKIYSRLLESTPTAELSIEIWLSSIIFINYLFFFSTRRKKMIHIGTYPILPKQSSAQIN